MALSEEFKGYASQDCSQWNSSEEKNHELDSERDRKGIICWLIGIPIAGHFKRVRWKPFLFSDAAIRLKAFGTR